MADELHNHLLGLEKFNGKVIDLASASVTAMQSPHSSDSLKIFFQLQQHEISYINPHFLNNTGKRVPYIFKQLNASPSGHSSEDVVVHNDCSCLAQTNWRGSMCIDHFD
jgi:hypothetical protein